jgi:hypothetical protein
MDILGVGAHHWEFPPDAKVMDGLDGRAGETQALRDIRAAHPELAVMSECQSEWTTAHTFYTWEGASHFTLPRAHPSIKTKVNHPFRTALWGSYTWTREAGIDPAESALAGALPELTPSDDWSVARARLFAAEELWNDLPDDWPDGALACYRGKDGKRFALRRLPYGDGYVELASARRQPLGQGAGAADTPRLVRLRGQTTSPFDAPGRIQGWLGYRDEKPIGLNPQRTYPLLFQSPKPEGEFWVTKLPAGVFIEAARPGKTQSVLELGAADGTAVMGEVEIVLHRPCVAICGRDTDLTGPLPANRRISLPTSAPGGWVFAWSGPKPADAPLLSRLAESTGHTLSTGAADYRGWCFNSSIRRLDASVGGKEHPAITMGPGRYRGWAEAWTALASGARPVLKFEIAFPVDLQKKPSAVRSLCCRVLVNGGEVWREELQPLADWRLHGVDLSPYAGRTVLITLSAEKVEESEPSHLEPSVLFGRVWIDHI